MTDFGVLFMGHPIQVEKHLGCIYQIFSVKALAEVTFEGGHAKATSQTAGRIPANAFILGHALGWHNDGQIFPSMVWYEFPAGKQFVPGRITFRPRQEDCCLHDTPTMWQFVGSNDETCNRFSNWTVLCQNLSGNKVPYKAWTLFCDVDDKIITEFRCLGITVLNTFNKSGPNAALNDVRIWKKVLNC